jgi:hypothetical protein
VFLDSVIDKTSRFIYTAHGNGDQENQLAGNTLRSLSAMGESVGTRVGQ